MTNSYRARLRAHRCYAGDIIDDAVRKAWRGGHHQHGVASHRARHSSGRQSVVLAHWYLSIYMHDNIVSPTSPIIYFRRRRETAGDAVPCLSAV